MTNKKALILTTALTGLSLLAGCHGRLPQGVPGEAVEVGGGSMFQFTAPTDGILCIVDTQRKSLFASKTMKAGEEVKFEGGDEDVMLLLGLREHGTSFWAALESNEQKALAMLEGIEMPVFALYFTPMHDLDLDLWYDDHTHDHDKADGHDDGDDDDDDAEDDDD